MEGRFVEDRKFQDKVLDYAEFYAPFSWIECVHRTVRFGIQILGNTPSLCQG